MTSDADAETVAGGAEFKERMRDQMLQWIDYGSGRDLRVRFGYVAKLLVLTALGVLIARFTSRLPSGTRWWLEPVFFQKLLVWNLLFEILGLGSASGPLTGKLDPMIGGFHYMGKRETVRIAPWPGKVPGTRGDARTIWDVTVYWAIVAILVILLLVPAGPAGSGSPFQAGFLPAALVTITLGLFVVGALRDKLIYLASRGEQYLLPLALFLVLDGRDLVIGLKLWIGIFWVVSAVAKMGRHFDHVVPVMVSNTVWLPNLKLRRALYRNYPTDLRPSRLGFALAQGLGMLPELVCGIALLVSPWRTVTLMALVVIMLYHLTIISNFPAAVPSEWNLMFMFWAFWGFWLHPAWSGWAITDADLSTVVIVAVLVMAAPVVGELRPDWVSFLPAARQYSGNWAGSVWAFRSRDIEDQLNHSIVKVAKNPIDQMMATGIDEATAELYLGVGHAARGLHIHGVGIISVMERHVAMDEWVLREGEDICDTVVGWSFGDGHLHDDRLVSAVARRCGFEPGDLIVVFLESKPIHSRYRRYRVIDGALGIVEKGRIIARDCKQAEPWLPDGPVRHEVEWQRDGYRAMCDPDTGPGPRGSAVFIPYSEAH